MDALGYVSVFLITLAIIAGIIGLVSAVRASRLEYEVDNISGRRIYRVTWRRVLMAVVGIVLFFVLGYAAGWAGSESSSGDVYKAYVDFFHLWKTFPFPG